MADILKGILLGGIVGVSATLWLCIGSLTVRYNNPLPPVSVKQCSLGSSNVTVTPSFLNFTNYASFEVFDGIDAKESWNQTTEILPAARSHVVSNITRNTSHFVLLQNITLRFFTRNNHVLNTYTITKLSENFEVLNPMTYEPDVG